MNTSEQETPKIQFEYVSTLTCFRCKATKYCLDCTLGYKDEQNFCSKCGKPLETLEAFENKDCPICSKKKISGFCKVLKMSSFTMPSFTQEQIERIQPRSGLIVFRYCDCGKYTPRSTHGVIDLSCANCGGQKKKIIYRW